VNQINSEIQLQVWKDLAISKQVLMSAATDALGLSSECSTGELKNALEQAIKRAKEADSVIVKIRNETEAQLAEMQQLVDASNKARIAAEEKVQTAETARAESERILAAGRADNAETVKKVRAELAEEKNKVKAISKALADTPENVVKKLKAFKKQKVEDAKVRDINEAQLKTARKEKTELKAEVDAQKALVKQAATLVPQIRELHSLCKQQNKFLQSPDEAREDLGEIPVLDDDLLNTLEKAVAAE
jgi:chromosome segregation ATPase